MSGSDCSQLAGKGSRSWTRTNNLPVNSRLLCQLSYAGPLRSEPHMTDTLAHASSVPARRSGAAGRCSGDPRRVPLPLTLIPNERYAP